jgi:hypothetical protein
MLGVLFLINVLFVQNVNQNICNFTMPSCPATALQLDAFLLQMQFVNVTDIFRKSCLNTNNLYWSLFPCFFFVVLSSVVLLLLFVQTL